MASFLLGEFLLSLVFHHIQFIIRVTPAQAEETDRIAAKRRPDKSKQRLRNPFGHEERIRLIGEKAHLDGYSSASST